MVPRMMVKILLGMRWIKIDKNERKEYLANGCQRMTTFCQWVNGCLITLIGFCLSHDALEFALGYIGRGFRELDAELHVACLKDIQVELVNGTHTSTTSLKPLYLLGAA